MLPSWPRSGDHRPKGELGGVLDLDRFCLERVSSRSLAAKRWAVAEQRRRKASLSVILYLDIKNAFNAVNHRSAFYILEAKGFPEEDLALFRRMYNGTFLVMNNHFGRT